MSWFPARQVFDGNTNIFQNIPASAIAGAKVKVITDTSRITPTIDGSAVSARQLNLASGTPFTWGSGGGTAGATGIVFIPGKTGVDLSATAVVTWGGVTMTDLGGAYNDNLSTSGWGRVFRILGVAAGGPGIPAGNQTISVTLTQAGQTFTGYGSSFSYKNVASVGALQTAFGLSTTPLITAPLSDPSDLVWGALDTLNTVASGFSFTVRQSATVTQVFNAGDTTGAGVFSATAANTVWSGYALDLSGTSAIDQVFTLPTTGVGAGDVSVVVNQMTSGIVTVQASDGSAVAVLLPNQAGVFRALSAAPTTSTKWAPTLVSNKGLLIAAIAATGTPSGSTFLRGDGTWSTPAVSPGGITPTAVKQANYTASAGDLVPCDVSGGSFAVTFPTAPADGTNVEVKLVKNNAGNTNVLTYNLGGSDVIDIASGATSGTLSLPGRAKRFQYYAASHIWYEVSSDDQLSQLDARYTSGLILPSDYGWKWYNFQPSKAYAASAVLTAGQTYAGLFHVPQADTIINVGFIINTAGSGLTSGQCFAGLLDHTGTLLSATADQSTNWTTPGTKVMALTTPQTVPAGWYYVAWYGNGTTLPKLQIDAASNPNLGAPSGSQFLTSPLNVLDTTHTGRTTSFFSPVTLTANASNYAFVGAS